jgi:ATP-binding cassette subfamily B protein
MQTPLGEGGGLVSGGEGQRVRLGRALGHPQLRLVVLDEPFRGLDRNTRARLLARVRTHWAAATLICITHDVAETQTFSRVLVIDGGRIVEEGTPADLAAAPSSRYRALLDAEERVRAHGWGNPAWRKIRLAEGRVEG